MRRIRKQSDYSRLLDLYFEGETTLEQEESLRLYFKAGKIAPEHERFSVLFEYVNDEKGFAYPRINRGNANRRRIYLFIGAVAAAVMLLIGAIELIENGAYNEYKLIMNGRKVHDKQLAINIANDKLEYLNDIMAKIGDQTGKMAKPGEAIKKLNILK